MMSVALDLVQFIVHVKFFRATSESFILKRETMAFGVDDPIKQDRKINNTTHQVTSKSISKDGLDKYLKDPV